MLRYLFSKLNEIITILLILILVLMLVNEGMRLHANIVMKKQISKSETQIEKIDQMLLQVEEMLP